MLEWLSTHGDQASGVTVLLIISILVITDRLVWHTRLKKAEARADKLERMLFELMGIVKPTKVALETTTEALTKLPIPRGSEE